MGEPFFTDVAGPIPFGGLDSTDPARVQGLPARPARARQADGGPPAARRLLLALVRLARRRTCSASGTLDRPWLAAVPTRWSRPATKMAAAFEFFAKLGVPYFCFHDRDVAPEGGSFAEIRANLDALVDDAGRATRSGPASGCCGARPTCSATRATRPAPPPTPTPRSSPTPRRRSSTCSRSPSGSAAQNYVLWGGREGYDTLLNTDLAPRGRAARAVPAPGRRAQAQDRLRGPAPDRAQAAWSRPSTSTTTTPPRSTASSSATGSRASTGSTSRPTTRRSPGHSFHHEVAYAVANGILGSIDANRGDPQNGWDTDQFPNSVDDLALPLYEILRGRRLHDRRLQLRRQAAPPEHRPDGPVPRPHRRHRHARASAARGGRPGRAWRARGGLRDARYAGWDGELGAAILGGALSSRTSRRGSRDGSHRPAAGPRAARSGSRTSSTRRSGRSTGPGGPERWASSSGSTSRRRRPRPSSSTRPAPCAAIGTADYGFEMPRPLWSEQDPRLWWDGAVDGDPPGAGRRRASGATTSRRIGLTGQMHGLVLLDAAARSCGRRSCGTTSGPPPSATRSARRSARSASSRSPATTR